LKENLNKYQYVFLSRPHISIKYIDLIAKHSNAKTIYFGHDIHHLRLERESKLLNKNLDKEIAESKSQEKELWTKCDYSLYPSDEEVEYVKIHCEVAKAIEVPIYFYNEHETSEERNYKESKGILFVGNFNHPPNHDGLKWFLNKIFPKIRVVIPDVTLNICGSDIPESIKGLESDSIRVFENLEDAELEKQYLNNRLSIVPLRFGAGVKGKILESLYHRLPIVTTTIGTQGVPRANECSFISDGPIEFGKHCIELYSNGEKWQHFSESSRSVLLSKYSSTNATNILEKILNY
jgi:glycosyltransferase involved in cell wall biosynthesis